MKTLKITLLSMFLVASLNGLNQEHPQEHPAEHPQEHPAEHPSEAITIDKDNLAVAIEQFVEQDAALKGGYFLVVDDKTGEVLKLKLDLVHKERLASLGDNTYFACADFKTPKGKTYDLDIFMKGKDLDDLKVTEIMIHKEKGKERYTWEESEGVWKRVPK